jgi:hypothetical protein
VDKTSRNLLRETRVDTDKREVVHQRTLAEIGQYIIEYYLIYLGGLTPTDRLIIDLIIS